MGVVGLDDGDVVRVLLTQPGAVGVLSVGRVRCDHGVRQVDVSQQRDEGGGLVALVIDLPLSEELRRGIADRGYVQPTPVQAAVIGPILAGRDLICRSKTGTGKTAAFGIPLLERIPGGTRKASALVLGTD